MTIPTNAFGPSALADLKTRTEYEAWLLESVYYITDQRIAVEDVDELIYPSSGASPKQTIYCIVNENIDDWRISIGFVETSPPYGRTKM